MLLNRWLKAQYKRKGSDDDLKVRVLGFDAATKKALIIPDDGIDNEDGVPVAARWVPMRSILFTTDTVEEQLEIQKEGDDRDAAISGMADTLESLLVSVQGILNSMQHRSKK